MFGNIYNKLGSMYVTGYIKDNPQTLDDRIAKKRAQKTERKIKRAENRMKDRANEFWRKEDAARARKVMSENSMWVNQFSGPGDIGPQRPNIGPQKPIGTTMGARDIYGKYTGSWGLDKNVLESASTRQLATRTRMFAFGGMGYNRENLTNAFGLLTKRQRLQKGATAFLTNRLVPAFGLYTLYHAYTEGEGAKEVVQTAGGIAGFNYAFRVSQSLGQTIGSTIGRAGLIGGGLGIAGGLVGGALVAAGVYAITESGNSNNFISSAASSLKSADFITQFQETDLTLTNRQRALQKISKSALNNRGVILGNEASVLNGFM